MTTPQPKMTQEEINKVFEKTYPENMMPKKMVSFFKRRRWKFNQWEVKKKYYGYVIYMEFMIGEIDVYLGSKNNGFMITDRKHCKNIVEALVATLNLETRIKSGEHWGGEND